MESTTTSATVTMEVTVKGKRGRKPGQKPVCSICHTIGHTARCCPTLGKIPMSQRAPVVKQEGGKRGRKPGQQGKCSICGAFGHNARTCPTLTANRQAKQTAKRQKAIQTAGTVVAAAGCMRDAPTYEAYLAKKTATGATPLSREAWQAKLITTGSCQPVQQAQTVQPEPEPVKVVQVEEPEQTDMQSNGDLSIGDSLQSKHNDTESGRVKVVGFEGTGDDCNVRLKGTNGTFRTPYKFVMSSYSKVTA